jgi:hypothetical protein
MNGVLESLYREEAIELLGACIAFGNANYLPMTTCR